MLSDEEMRERMRKGWRGGLGDGTVCGGGSTLGNSRNVVEWLPDVCDRYGIESVCDAGAGDLHWVSRISWNVDYQPFDLFPRRPEVTELDITAENLPDCDAILCRMVLNHLYGDEGDDTRIVMALERFRMSARYLMATSFHGNNICRDRQFVRLDLREYLGEPLEVIPDGHETGCYMGLWDLRS